MLNFLNRETAVGWLAARGKTRFRRRWALLGGEADQEG